MLQVGGEDRLGEAADGVVEEGLLRRRRDRVEAAEGEAEQAGGAAVGGEGAGDLLGRLNGLGGHGQAADADNVGVDIAARCAAIAVRDGPGCARQFLGRAAAARLVQRLAIDLAAGGLGAEDPEVAGAGVEIQVEDLSGRANADGGQVLGLRELALAWMARGCEYPRRTPQG